MRLNGFTVGVGLGGLLLIAPQMLMSGALLAASAPLWPYRMAGAVLVALGLHLLVAAQERIVRAATMLAMLVGNGLMAVVLLVAFLQRELAALGGLAQMILSATFFICVVAALFALRYLREDYNMV